MNILSKVKKINSCRLIYSSKAVNKNLKTPKEILKIEKEIEIFSKSQIIQKLRNSYVFPYLSSNYLDFIERNFRKLDDKTSLLYVVDSEVAKDIASKIIKDETNDDCTYIEKFPGPGLLTYIFLTKTKSEIEVHDQYHNWSLVLKQFKKKIPKNFVLKHLKPDYNKNSAFTYFLTDKPKKVIGLSKNLKYFKYLTLLCKKVYLWSSLVKTTFYFAVTPDVANALKDSSRFWSVAGYKQFCVFSLLFDVEIIGTYNNKYFFPLSSIENDKNIYLMKIKLKKKPIINVEGNEGIYFWQFIEILQKSKYQYIIPVLEDQMPGSGLYLISKGVSMMMQTQDMTLSEVLLLFELLKNDNWFESLKCKAENLNG